MAIEVPGTLPSSQSSTQLIRSNHGDSESVLNENVEDNKSDNVGRRSRLSSESRSGYSSVSKKEWFTVSVLCFINLINYMDRFTIAGKTHFTVMFTFAKIPLSSLGAFAQTSRNPLFPLLGRVSLVRRFSVCLHSIRSYNDVLVM
jgi:hypothetical protein